MSRELLLGKIRDEIARWTIGEGIPIGTDDAAEIAPHVLDVITPTIDSVDELEALDPRSVVIDSDGDPWIKGDDMFYIENFWVSAQKLLRLYGPVRLVHRS